MTKVIESAVAALVLTACMADPALAQNVDDGSVEDITVSVQRKTALQAETLSISATPEASPHLEHPSYIVGLGALVSPVYDGSKKTQTSPYPYVDIRGLWDDRLFISSLRGIGFNAFEAGPFRGGLTLNYSAGRTSSDDPRLKGLPDTSSGAAAGAFLTWSYRALTLEAEAINTFGGSARTEAAFGLNYSFMPLPRLQLSVGPHVNWGDSRFERVTYGVTAAEAAQANALGNPLTPYQPKAGITTVGVTAAGLYQIGKHWGVVSRIGLQELVGSGAKDSPLTQRNFAPSIAVGALYQF